MQDHNFNLSYSKNNLIAVITMKNEVLHSSKREPYSYTNGLAINTSSTTNKQSILKMTFCTLDTRIYLRARNNLWI